MTLYNLVHGSSGFEHEMVMLLKSIQPFEVGRFRDAWVERDGDDLLIRVHTRNGGGNREDYEAEIESMQDHPWYVRDADDDFDCTYADFWFRPRKPDNIDADGWRTVMETLISISVNPVNMRERWEAAIEAIRTAPIPPKEGT